MHCEVLITESGDERKWLRRVLLQLNEWITEEQVERAVFELKHVSATGIARNQAVYEYLTYMLLDVNGQADGGRARYASSTLTTGREASTSS